MKKAAPYGKRRAAKRAGMIVTTVALEPEMHRRASIAALEDRSTLAQFLRDALVEYLDRRARKRGKRE
jgi:hypothetical protein